MRVINYLLMDYNSVQPYNGKGVKLKERNLGLHLSLSFISANNTSTPMQIEAQKCADHIMIEIPE